MWNLYKLQTLNEWITREEQWKNICWASVMCLAVEQSKEIKISIFFDKYLLLQSSFYLNFASQSERNVLANDWNFCSTWWGWKF